MIKPNDRNDGQPTKAIWGTVLPLLFGLAVLTFLTVIERQSWFHIRPASGTAMALAYASDSSAKPRANTVNAQ